MREVKDRLYEQVSRIGKALASPKRLELVELLCQGEKSVETLAQQADISVKLASAHLKELRAARLVGSRKDGKYVIYRLFDSGVAELWVSLRAAAEERLLELQMALRSLVTAGTELVGVDRNVILKQAERGSSRRHRRAARRGVRSRPSALCALLALVRAQEAAEGTAQGQTRSWPTAAARSA